MPPGEDSSILASSQVLDTCWLGPRSHLTAVESRVVLCRATTELNSCPSRLLFSGTRDIAKWHRLYSLIMYPGPIYHLDDHAYTEGITRILCGTSLWFYEIRHCHFKLTLVRPSFWYLASFCQVSKLETHPIDCSIFSSSSLLGFV